MTTTTPTPVLRSLRPAAHPTVRYVLFPPAGAGPARSFGRWADHVGPHVDLCGVELPGHGARVLEEPHRRLSAMVDEAAAGLERLDSMPTVLVGHSLGALVAFGVAAEHRPPHLVGLVAAHARSPRALGSHHTDANDAFESTLRTLRRQLGEDALIIRHAEMHQLFERTLVSDIRAVAEYRHRPDRVVDVPVLVVAGDRDTLAPPGTTRDWATVTTGPLRFTVLRGGHEAVHEGDHPRLVCDLVRTVFAVPDPRVGVLR